MMMMMIIRRGIRHGKINSWAYYLPLFPLVKGLANWFENNCSEAIILSGFKTFIANARELNAF